MNNYFQPEPIGNFNVTVNIPGSKSITNRALILSALSGKKVILKNILLSDDTKYMIDALKVLNNKIELDEINKTIVITGNKNPKYDNIELFIGNAGTAMRFLSSYLATGEGTATLYGNKRMNERPIKDLVDSLTQLGVKVEYLNNYGYPPIKIISKGVNSKSVSIDGSKSSQYISSILMAAPNFKSPIDIKLTGKIVSKPYINMTLDMMKDFGIEFSLNENSIKIMPQEYSCSEYLIEGDMSSASYFLAMALISNSTVKLNNFFQNSIQGDSKFLDILIKMGLSIVEFTNTSITVKGIPSYEGIEISMNDTPDVAQTLAVVALFATTPTKVWDVENMRIKETDRISALKNEISKINGEFIEFKDGFSINPKPQDCYTGNYLETYDDHRMAMSLCLIGLKVPNIKILDPQCVSKTFPNFFEEFCKIYKED
ncbi:MULTISPECIES: 3-phosphoshikimate 1-carboxyvinyltransferase [Cetobacterium]|jgi:3-phosphoshikimate 1-carboxyvinyltransferase|uniref:3-phosphoshikimate 1-carboxyvinyltransferase n=1 Tax=Candidatus Cetobacterium colombiensis TaxID=3073100 RepID=A0ABU4W790_9FUSO|nr:3-phosphoshikimate 1-carboxyvinyltransferase [Candidatus Cetobacterium colombiensis]MDX8335401.1 3-phosphoshikimate 1-carboxyvinyltransferase [Candidatus Cetobacterium colombiensis]